MTNAEIIEVKALQICIMQLNSVIESLAEQIRYAHSSDNTDKFAQLPEWITLKQAVELKGGAALATYKARYRLQPLRGKAEAYIGGVKVWSLETIRIWLKLTDEELDAKPQIPKVAGSNVA